MDVIIKNGIVITMDRERRILNNFSIGIEEGRIAEISKSINEEADFVIDAGNKIVIPGLINTHTHLSMTLFRGIADDIPLMEWLEGEIWPIEGKLEAKHVYAGALLGCTEMIKSGTTCFNDMYWHMEEVAKAVEESGIRAVLSCPLIDLGDTKKGMKMLKEGEQSVKKYTKRDGRVTAFFGPHAPYTCSKELLIKTKELSQKYETGIHMHVSETKDEVKNAEKELGMPPFEYLDDIGILGNDFVAAHSVWVSEKEMGIIKKRGVKISHNPVSNMKIASGIAPVPEYVDKDIVVSLGTDGAASNNNLDLFEDMKICALLHKSNTMNPSIIPAEKVLEFATINGAKALGLDKDIGSIEVGKKADIVMINLEKTNLTPLTNPISHLVYAAKGCDVDTVLVDGKVIMEEGELRTLKEDSVLKFANEECYDLFEKAGKLDRLYGFNETS